MRYAFVIQYYSAMYPGEIYEIVENPKVTPNSINDVYVIKIHNKHTGTRWLAKDCCKVVTKEQDPEYFL